ncbi:MAG TPA: hypothetical protein VD768_04780 [Sphingomicrobium sp.]|nr:hypothetical protein [Sphingomicrobium sp.]
MNRIALALIAGLSFAAPAYAQTAAPAAPAATASDAAAIDATLDAVYAVISGPAGQARDWDKMRSLFTPEARLSAIGSKGVRGGGVEDYIKNSGPFLTKEGFTERELARRIEVYGNLAHAWSSYDGETTGGKLKVRGINSFQLVRQPDGSWKVFSILWQQETPQIPLPADMAGNR